VNRARANLRAILRRAVLIFAVATAVNYVWELAQAPLYVGMTSFGATLWHCFVASLGDGVLVLVIFAAGWAALSRTDWYAAPGTAGYGLMLTIGLAIGVAVEWIALEILGRWAYTDRMPLVPGLGVGIVPVAQMVVLPPLVFRIVGGNSKQIPQGDTR
jgi:hypothetical protein